MNFNSLWLDSSDDPREALPPGEGEKAVLAEYLALQYVAASATHAATGPRSRPPWRTPMPARWRSSSGAYSNM